jgi:hypothetical protein
MKRILISQVIPKELVVKYQVSQAGNNFGYRLVAYQLFDEVFSLCPISIKNRIKISESPYHFIQRRIVPHRGMLRLLNMAFENVQLFLLVCNRNRRDHNIWFYNLTVSNCLLFILLKMFNRRIYVLVADYEPKFASFSFGRLLHILLNRADGIIGLSSNMKGLSNKNTEVLSGLIDESLPKHHLLDKKPKNRFLYAGALEEYCGVELALTVFKDLPGAELLITGRGTYRDKVIEYTNIYPNIKYLGFMTYEEYLSVIESVDFCLSLRDPAIPFNSYNFPSKIIEFCQMGKIVISTMRYLTFPESVLVYAPFGRHGLLEAIQHCILMDDDAVRRRKMNAQDSMFAEYGRGSWLNKIVCVEEYEGE